MKLQQTNLEFETELNNISLLLQSPDKESRALGYSLLRESKFKKYMRGRLWSENNKSFYRFHLYRLKTNLFPQNTQESYSINWHNDNKILFANKVVCLYLQKKLLIKKPKWQE